MSVEDIGRRQETVAEEVNLSGAFVSKSGTYIGRTSGEIQMLDTEGANPKGKLSGKRTEGFDYMLYSIMIKFR